MAHQEVFHLHDGLPWNCVNSNELQAYYTLIQGVIISAIGGL